MENQNFANFFTFSISEMSTEARTIIGAWRKDLNSYRRLSKEHVKNYIKLVEKSNDDTKEQLIDIYGKFYLKIYWDENGPH